MQASLQLMWQPNLREPRRGRGTLKTIFVFSF